MSLLARLCLNSSCFCLQLSNPGWESHVYVLMHEHKLSIKHNSINKHMHKHSIKHKDFLLRTGNQQVLEEPSQACHSGHEPARPQEEHHHLGEGFWREQDPERAGQPCTHHGQSHAKPASRMQPCLERALFSAPATSYYADVQLARHVHALCVCFAPATGHHPGLLLTPCLIHALFLLDSPYCCWVQLWPCN